MRFKINIDPRAKERPRFNSFSKQISVFTPKKTKDFQEAIRQVVAIEFGRGYSFPVYGKGVPLEVNIDLVFQRPKNMMGKNFEDGLIWKPTKPDRDNSDKAVLDALTGVLYADDNQVVTGVINKLYTEKTGKPRVCIQVLRAGDPPVRTVDIPSKELHDQLAERKRGIEDDIEH